MASFRNWRENETQGKDYEFGSANEQRIIV